MLLNLTTNALKFSSEGYVEVKVAEVGGDIVECSVRDTGRGVPAAAMPTLFEPFRRRQKPGDYAFSGSGLGLSICRKLVEAMGAELTVKTVQAEGTCFSFRLVLPAVIRAMAVLMTEVLAPAMSLGSAVVAFANDWGTDPTSKHHLMQA